MKIKPEQLAQHLNKGLAPIYIIGGDEPLLVQEASDAVRKTARANGFTREVLHAGRGFDWNNLLQMSSSMSLFAEQRLIELRLPTGKPGDDGRKALATYLQQSPPDTVLMIITGKLEQATTRTKWFGALEHAGVFVQVWPIEARQLPGWIMQRMRAQGVQADQEAAALLAEKVEGNLLAAVQEIEKLKLLYGDTAIDAARVARAVVDSSRFDVYKLMDATLEGNSKRVVRIIEGLRAEGVAMPLVLWAVARELRSLAQMAAEVDAGAHVDQVMGQFRVWAKRQVLVKQGLKRFNSGDWRDFLLQAGRIDRMSKGLAPGNIWDELLQLGLSMTGRPFLSHANTG